MNKFLSQIEKKGNFMGAAASSIGRGMKVMGRRVGRQIASDAGKIGGQAQQLATGKVQLNGSRFQTRVSAPGARMQAGRDMIKNKALIAGTVGGVAGGSAIASMSRSTAPSTQDQAREKRACVEMLMSNGVAFDDAVELTKLASEELYGE